MIFRAARDRPRPLALPTVELRAGPESAAAVQLVARAAWAHGFAVRLRQDDRVLAGRVILVIGHAGLVAP